MSDQKGGKDLPAKRRRFDLHLVPFFGATSLSKIKNFDVERYKKIRAAAVAIRGGEEQKPNDSTKLKTTTAGTINRELAVLSHVSRAF